MDDYKNTDGVLIASAQCAGDSGDGSGMSLCKKYNTSGYPHIVYGNPSNPSDYNGAREYSAFSKFAKQHFGGPSPSPSPHPSPQPSPHPSPHPTPSPSPSPSGCHDVYNWRTREGDSCSDFEQYNYCTPNGRTGNGWRSQWGSITSGKYRDRNGYTCFQACCACGGGSRGDVDEVAEEWTVVQPTCPLTSDVTV